MSKLTDEQIESSLKAVPEWVHVGDSIQRTYQFKDFVQSMKFVSQIAEQAESANHHPDILIRYSRVTLTLQTHDAGGITDKDFSLAAGADELAAQYAPPVRPSSTRKKKA
jgi:4a-hydroxytetrahydrobiopterin dehydratase